MEERFDSAEAEEDAKEEDQTEETEAEEASKRAMMT
jgi:hypothetical protein